MTRIQNLLSTRDLDAEVVQLLFNRAAKLKRMRGVLSAHDAVLDGETVANLFWEVSTRTRISFELAARRLGAEVVTIFPQYSNITKGEKLLDTVLNLRALGCRFFVLRHPDSGAPAELADGMARGSHIINGGDGTNEHPTQALDDAFTIREYKKRIEGLEIAILGDIVRSRVAHSNQHLLAKLGAKVRLAGPPELLPPVSREAGAVVCGSVEEALEGADVVMALRIQRERAGASTALSDEEYHGRYGVTSARLALAKPDAIVMHPGPINRGVEIDARIADGPQSVVLKQAENGLYVRMAIFEAIRGEIG